MVGACVLNIIINIFQPNNYGQLSGYSAFRQNALKWFSNTWCKLHILLYSYGVCASRNNSVKIVHMHRQNIFLLFIYSMSGNFSQAGSIVFRFSVYNVLYCNNAHSKLKQ